jgi:uncharacterized protein with WD repeat
MSEAVLMIYKYDNYNGYQNPNTFNVYRITNEWEESSANWTKRTSTSNWSNAGGDYNNTVIATYDYNGNYNGWFDFTVTDAVKDMISDPSSDYGFLISIEDLNPGSSGESHNVEAYFHSTEADNDDLKPHLVIKGSGTSINTKQHTVNLFQKKLTRNVLSLFFPEKNREMFTVTITDISGKTLLRKKISGSVNKVQFHLDYSAGLYCISVSTQRFQQVKNIILY